MPPFSQRGTRTSPEPFFQLTVGADQFGSVTVPETLAGESDGLEWRVTWSKSCVPKHKHSANEDLLTLDFKFIEGRV